MGTLLHVFSYQSLTSEVSGSVWTHGAKVTSKQSREALCPHFSVRPHQHICVPSCVDIHANAQLHVDSVKEHMKEARPRLGQRRKEAEHTPGSEQEAARKKDFDRMYTHTFRELELYDVNTMTQIY